MPLGDPTVDQLDCAIDAGGILQLGEAEDEIRPLGAGRQVVAREGIDMRGRVERRVSVVVYRGHERCTPMGESTCRARSLLFTYYISSAAGRNHHLALDHGSIQPLAGRQA
jgi:hypothetical protein